LKTEDIGISVLDIKIEAMLPSGTKRSNIPGDNFEKIKRWGSFRGGKIGHRILAGTFEEGRQKVARFDIVRKMNCPAKVNSPEF
jgi:hypothetical protein